MRFTAKPSTRTVVDLRWRVEERKGESVDEEGVGGAGGGLAQVGVEVLPDMGRKGLEAEGERGEGSSEELVRREGVLDLALLAFRCKERIECKEVVSMT